MAQYHWFASLDSRNSIHCLHTYFTYGKWQTYWDVRVNSYSHRKRFFRIPSQSSTPSRTWDAISFGTTGEGGPRIRSSPTRMVSSIVSCLSTVDKNRHSPQEENEKYAGAQVVANWRNENLILSQISERSILLLLTDFQSFHLSLFLEMKNAIQCAEAKCGCCSLFFSRLAMKYY